MVVYQRRWCAGVTIVPGEGVLRDLPDRRLNPSWREYPGIAAPNTAQKVVGIPGDGVRVYPGAQFIRLAVRFRACFHHPDRRIQRLSS